MRRDTVTAETRAAIRGTSWRDFMERTREIARALAREGAIEITRRGERMRPDARVKGPIRLRLAAPPASPRGETTDDEEGGGTRRDDDDDDDETETKG